MSRSQISKNSIFRHIIITNEAGQRKEYPFRNRAVAFEFKAKAEKAGIYEGYEIRTIGFDKLVVNYNPKDTLCDRW